MKRMLFKSTLAVLLLASSSQAFDDHKEGFMIGVGLGASYTYLKNSGDNGLNEKRHETNMATSLKLGYGMSEQMLVYVTSQSDALSGEKDDYVGFFGLGADYYPDPCNSFYITGALGVTRVPDVKNSNDRAGGYGVLLGAGYEIAPHISVEMDYLHTGLDKDSIDTKGDSVRALVSYTWY